MIYINYKIRYAITEASKHWKSNSLPSHNEKVQFLKSDILNGPRHVFGDHEKCAR